MSTKFGETLKALREDAGLSLHALAYRVRWSKATLGHAETGRRRVSPELARALDRELQAGGVLIALAAAERDQRRTAEDVRRRPLLIGIAASIVVLASNERPAGRLGGSDLELLLARTAELRRLDDALGGGDTFGLYLAEVERTEALLSGTSQSEEAYQGLNAILSEQAQLAGWAAFDAGWLDRSELLYAQSAAAASEANDAALFANALALNAYQRAFTGEPDPALAQASCAALTDRVPAEVRALVFDRAAWTFAVSGRTYEAETALGHAADALTSPRDAPAPDWAAWVDAVELDIMTGRCWSALRRPLRAVAPLKRALSEFPDEYARDKALYSLALADAYLHARELELAAETIRFAWSLTKGVASTRPGMQLRRTLALSAAYGAEGLLTA